MPPQSMLSGSLKMQRSPVLVGGFVTETPVPPVPGPLLLCPPTPTPPDAPVRAGGSQVQAIAAVAAAHQVTKASLLRVEDL
jgi:hypothetical protein